MNIHLRNSPVRRGLAGLLLLIGWLLTGPAAYATHLRAGDIQSRTDPNNPRHIFFTMVLYTSAEPNTADEAEVDIFFGDGTCVENIPRVGNRQLISPETYRNVYTFDHTYNSPGTYKVMYLSVNRVQSVVNMFNSVNTSFYIYTSVTIDPFLQNTSPVLQAPPIDKATIRQVFLHNPAAFDADGDSLTFALQPSQQAPPPATCTPTPSNVAGFRYPADPALGGNPQQVAYTGPPVGVPGAAAIFVIDPRTGQITWNSPAVQGVYNIALVVREYRRIPGAAPRLVGEVVRDMQIFVQPTTNQRPVLVIPPDICVVANTPVPNGVVTATDPDNNPILLEAFGGMLPQPGSFVQSTQGPPTARGLFTWTPTCANIRSEPYQVLFKATDDPTGVPRVPLIDEKVWRITVVGPAPQNLVATRRGNNARLKWASYSCKIPGAQILIFRRQNSFPFTPGPCDTGLPAGSGYEQIGTANIDSVGFTDTNRGNGLVRGNTYCYRIYVLFPSPGGGKSIASNESCVEQPGRPARLLNVTVDRTDATNGQITVRWSKPTPVSLYPSPSGYYLYRAPGISPDSTTMQRIAVLRSLNDTVFVDTRLNTVANAYTYQMRVFKNTTQADSVERTKRGSSVRLETVPNSLTTTIRLTWTYQVPWDNTRRPTTIYRRDPGGQFRPIAKVTGTATGGTFLDQGTTAAPLRREQAYCYYVKTNGTYNATLADSLINLSQESCASLKLVPCAPVLRLKPINCDSLASRLFDLPVTPLNRQVYINRLQWSLSNQPSGCSRNIVQYIILGAEDSSQPFTEIARVSGRDSVYEHRLENNARYCYQVQAVEANGEISQPSNVECQDNCLLFLLPNIFTPNGDGKNDTFRPKVFSPISRTAVKIFNRWGVKVYESDRDPLINWTGSGSAGEGNPSGGASDGMYFYQAEVEFKDANRTKRTFKGWVQINR